MNLNNSRNFNAHSRDFMKKASIINKIFLVIGIGMLIGSFFMYSNTKEFLNSAIETEGVVTELVRSHSSDSIMYRPIFEFKTQEGKTVEITSSVASNPPSYSRGEKIDVLYQESAPEKAKINSFFSLWGATLIVGVIGLVFLLIAVFTLVFGLLKNKKVVYLKKNGVPVTAKFQSVDINSTYEINGKHPYQISAQWKNPATSELHIFKSENIWFDPTDHISQDHVTVLIEKDNPKKYYMDISFLPKVAS